MPRKRRIIVPGEVHHVMSRGLDGMDLFRDDTDRVQFLSILSSRLPEAKCCCYAWVLMDNHYHLLLRPLALDLKTIMRRINCSYANNFNRRHKRRGYVFQDRYKSLATQEYFYFRELVRYIHLNPLRAGIVKNFEDLARYPWSGHQGILGRNAVPWQAVDEALFRFGQHRSSAREKYLQFLKEGIGQDLTGWRVKATPAGDTPREIDDRITGDSEFIRKAMSSIESEQRLRHDLLKKRPALEELLSNECVKEGIEVSEGLTRGRLDARTKARVNFCLKAVKHYSYTAREVALFIGINPGTVSRMIKTAKV